MKPYFKPSQRGSVLSCTSPHPAAQHKSWPSSKFHTFEVLSSSPHYAIEAEKTFLAKLRRQDPSSMSIPVLSSSLAPNVDGRADNIQTGSWLVLPYHPAFLPLHAVVASIAKHWHHLAKSYEQLSIGLFAPRLGWARGNRTLMQVLSHEPQQGGEGG